MRAFKKLIIMIVYLNYCIVFGNVIVRDKVMDSIRDMKLCIVTRLLPFLVCKNRIVS